MILARQHYSANAAAASETMPLVLLHAYPLSGAMYAPLAEEFAADNREILAIDFRGFGASEAGSEPFTIEQFALDVIETCAAASIHRAVFGGCSLGGYVAFELWRRKPELVAGLVLMDTRAEGDSSAALEKRQAQIKRLREEGTGFIPGFVAENLLGTTTQANSPEVVEKAKALAAAPSAETLIRATELLAARPDSTLTLPSITVPTLVLVGAEDKVTPRECAETLAREIPAADQKPGTELVEIAEAGHLAPLERPTEVAAAIRQFYETATLL